MRVIVQCFICITLFASTNLYCYVRYDYSLHKDDYLVKFLDQYVSSFGTNLDVNTVFKINNSANLFIKVYDSFISKYLVHYSDIDKKALLKKLKLSLIKEIKHKENFFKNTPNLLIKKIIVDVFNNIEPHTAIFFDNEVTSYLKSKTQDHFGLGIAFLKDEHHNLLVKRILNPAIKKYDINIGDKIIAVNGILLPTDKDYKNNPAIYNKLLKNLFLEIKNKIIKHKNEIKFIIERDNIRKEILFKATHYKIPSVNAMVLDKKYLYINISSFMQYDVVSSFKRALQNNNINKLQGLIIDLRYNAGGLLNHAAAIGNMLLPNMVFVNAQSAIRPYDFHSNITAYNNMIIKTDTNMIVNKNIPIVVITDTQTMSAAEILAGVLGLSKRAVLIGEKTFGKWVGQETEVNIEYNFLFKITTLAIYIGNNVTFQGEGFSPDIEIKSKYKFHQIKEKDLPGSINIDNIKLNQNKSKLHIDETQCPVTKNEITFDNNDYFLGCAKLFLNSKSDFNKFSKELISQTQSNN